MKTRTVNQTIGLLLICLLCASVVTAQQTATDPGPSTNWGIGARVGYLYIPDFILGGFYDDFTGIDAVFYGLYGSYSFKKFDLQFGLNHYLLNFQNGKWLVSGEDEKEETDFVEADLQMIDLDITAMWKFDLHQYVRYRIGAGMGFGFIFGKYESFDYLYDEDEEKYIKQTESEEPDLPPVIPIITFQTGFFFHFIPDRFGLNVDFGVRNGLYVGGGLQGFF